MTAATQPATPAAPNNNEPVRVNHTARNVIITIVVVAIIAVAAFFGTTRLIDNMIITRKDDSFTCTL